MNKREFLKVGSSAVLAGQPLIDFIYQLNNKYLSSDDAKLVTEENYWAEIRNGYRLKPDYINLENGYYCFTPESTLNHFLDHIREVNYQGSYYMRTVQWENKDKSAKRLAELAGCGADELIITRNTTESLDTVINGLQWKAGDEAVMAEQDYGSIVGQFKLMAARHGIVNKIISLPNHPASDDDIVKLYASVITPKTKLLLISHMVNITGQILPIRKICDMAHVQGVEVMVDGAHAFAHINFKISDLGCDYYGASLHKWLSVPLGAGILYVKKDKIHQLWPTFAPWNDHPDDIKKLNHTGTHPVHTDLAIKDAIDYYIAIGATKKEERLRYLQNYWTEKVRNIKGIVVNTPSDPARSCGIANVGLEFMTPAEMAKVLLDKYKIWAVAIDGQGVRGCRITPNIYTSTAELDIFVAALLEMNNSKR
jgi:selenocysteine lyase/cysteine desulfurase